MCWCSLSRCHAHYTPNFKTLEYIFLTSTCTPLEHLQSWLFFLSLFYLEWDWKWLGNSILQGEKHMYMWCKSFDMIVLILYPRPSRRNEMGVGQLWFHLTSQNFCFAIYIDNISLRHHIEISLFASKQGGFDFGSFKNVFIDEFLLALASLIFSTC